MDRDEMEEILYDMEELVQSLYLEYLLHKKRDDLDAAAVFLKDAKSLERLIKEYKELRRT